MKAIYRLILGIVICSLSVVSSYGQWVKSVPTPQYVSVSTNGAWDSFKNLSLTYYDGIGMKPKISFVNFRSSRLYDNVNISWEEGSIRHSAKVSGYELDMRNWTETEEVKKFSNGYEYVLVQFPGMSEDLEIDDILTINRRYKLDATKGEFIKDKFFFKNINYIFNGIYSDEYVVGRWSIAIPFNVISSIPSIKSEIESKRNITISIRFKNKRTGNTLPAKFDAYSLPDVVGNEVGLLTFLYNNKNTTHLEQIDNPYITYGLTIERNKYSSNLPLNRYDFKEGYPKVYFSYISGKEPMSLYDFWKQHLPDNISESQTTEEYFNKTLFSGGVVQFKGMTEGFLIDYAFKKRDLSLKLGDVLNGAIELDPSSGNLPYGTEVRITAIPNDNCKLSAIYINGKPIKSNITKEGNIYKTTFTIEENTVVSAEFVSTIHNITKKPSVNGKYTLSQELNIPEGSKVSVTATPDEGYVLDKVIVNGKAIKGTTFVVDNDCTVEVVFKKRDCFITCTIDGDGRLEISPNKDVVPYGTEITVNPIAGKDFILEKLLVDGKMLIDRKVVVTKNVEIFASFIRKPKDMLNVEVLNPVDGKIFARNATTGEYYTGNSEIRANTLLLLKIEYDKNKYDFGGFTFDGKIFDGYQLRIERKGILSAILKPKSEYSIRGAINIETSQNGIYTITTPDKYIDTEISVIDIMGRVISKHKIQSNITTIDLSTQHSGILLLKFNDNVKKIKHRRI